MLRAFRPRWLDIFLMLAVISLVLYMQFFAQIVLTRPEWASLWSNVTTDLFGIWLTVRLIDGLNSLRQRRQQVVLGFRGNINYTMQRASELLPEPRAWDLRALANEIRWLEIRRERQLNYLKRDERDRIDSTYQKLKAVVADANELSGLYREVSHTEADMHRSFDAARKEGDHPYEHEITSLAQLKDDFREYVRYEDSDGAVVAVSVQSVKGGLGVLNINVDVRDKVARYVSAIEAIVGRRAQLEGSVREYVNYVRDSEMVLLKGVDD